jgi:hypothetical protein
MTSRARFLTALLLLATSTTAACHQRREGRRDTELLTRQEMVENHFTNLHEAVSSLRAYWLNVRGTDSFSQPSQIWVYFDQTRLGGVDELRAITVSSVVWARHYNGVDATMRWGVGHSAGVILVSSVR